MECKQRGDCCWDFEDTCVESSMGSEDKFIIACGCADINTCPNAYHTPHVLLC